jgi:hypothetical protein
MMQLHQAWAAMTVAQRTQWNQFISFSNSAIRRDKSVLLTGHALFIKYNFLRLLSQLSILTDINYTTITSFPLPWEFSADEVTLGLNFNANFDSNVVWPVVRISPAQRSSLSFTKRGLRFMFDAWSSRVGNDLDFFNSYINAFGAVPPVGSFVHIESTFISMTAPIVSQTITGIYETLAP